MKYIYLCLVLLVVSLTCSAQQPVRAYHAAKLSHVGHYIRTHKSLLLIDGIDVAGGAADWASTRYAQRVCGSECVDLGSFGAHPTNLQVGIETMWGPAIGVVFNHLAWHHYRKDGPDPDRVGRTFWSLFIGVPLGFHAYSDVISNLNAVDLEQARAHVLKSGE